jgi:hypothetical protein
VTVKSAVKSVHSYTSLWSPWSPQQLRKEEQGGLPEAVSSLRDGPAASPPGLLRGRL